MSTVTAAPAFHVPEDFELVERARARDPQAFAQIMRRNNRRLFRCARAILRDDSEAQDVVQSAYLAAFTSLDRFAGHASLSTWLTRIAVNEALMRLRRRRRLAGSFEDIDDEEMVDAMTRSDQFNLHGSVGLGVPETEAVRVEMRGIVEHAIDALPEVFRAVFVLRAVEELSVEETAESLGIPEATVKTRFHRARERLRGHLEKRLDLTLPEAFSFAGPRCERVVTDVLRILGLEQPDSTAVASAEPSSARADS
ncbi:MAG TPA: RNA polymerase sigma factor [Povalibacter sp.]|nr:RNA polymerase sigma factor [Povalibacter sp.]